MLTLSSMAFLALFTLGQASALEGYFPTGASSPAGRLGFGGRNGGGACAFRGCELLRRETLCETRGEPVRRFTFRVPPGSAMDVETALRQVVVVMAGDQRRMYSPTSEPNRADGTFELVVRIYRGGRVSGWLDSLPLGSLVPMKWPWPAPLRADRRNPGERVGLVAFGIGITELYRMAAAELRDPAVREVALLYATRTAEEQQVLRPELEDLAAEHPGRFRLERALSRECVSGFHAGRVDARMLAAAFPWAGAERASVRFLAAGTREMIERALAMLDSLGYDRATYKLIRDNTVAAGQR